MKDLSEAAVALVGMQCRNLPGEAEENSRSLFWNGWDQSSNSDRVPLEYKPQQIWLSQLALSHGNPVFLPPSLAFYFCFTVPSF